MKRGLVSPYNGEARDHEVLVALWAQLSPDYDRASVKTNIFEAYLSDLGLNTLQ
jgi:hypothetical protein